MSFMYVCRGGEGRAVSHSVSFAHTRSKNFMCLHVSMERVRTWNSSSTPQTADKAMSPHACPWMFCIHVCIYMFSLKEESLDR